MTNFYNLKDKKFLITGGTGGIGSKVVENLLNIENAEIFFTSSSQVKADNLMSKLSLEGKKIHSGVFDMNEHEQILQLVHRAIETMNGIDVLICNAGTNDDKFFTMLKAESWNKIINVNLTGNFHLASSCVRKMISQRSGRIIFISSVSPSVGNAGQTNYCAAKAGVEGMMRCMATELGRYNICVNAIAPGFIETEMTDKLPDSIKASIKARIPMNLFGKTDDVYEMIAFLSSEGGRYITGQTIHVNGGMYFN